MTWLDIGNGWRNLFLLSCALQAAALGLWFCLRGWFSPRHRVACFLTGVAATPVRKQATRRRGLNQPRRQNHRPSAAA